VTASGAQLGVRTDAVGPEECDDPGVRPTLLIVDDHPGFRASARRLLEAEGFAVVGDAEDVRTGLAEVARLTPDVVLVDIALPDGDGFSLCAALVASHDSTVVLTSSRPIAGLLDRVQGSRARGFIPKSELSGPTIRALTG
jgi:DNA-binding NarL/FixJ family response regulator